MVGDINTLFIELIQVSLGVRDDLSVAPTAEQWRELYDSVIKQTLIGVCFVGAEKMHSLGKGPDKTLYYEWARIVDDLQQHNKTANKECLYLREMLRKMGYRSCIIKGQANAELYGELSPLRQTGDIDVWIEGGRKKVIDLVQSIAPTNEIRETHAQLRVFSDIEVEAHYRPGLMTNFVTNARLQRFFKEHAEECFSGNSSFKQGGIGSTSWNFDAVHQLSHIHHHLFAGGVGLRQVMDYYFVLRSMDVRQGDKAEAWAVIKKCGMGRFCAALMWIMEQVFKLDEAHMICAPDEKDGQFLLNEIIISGNFGHQDERKKYDSSSYIQNFFGLIVRNLGFSRFAPFECIMSPIWRIYYFSWRKLHGYK